AKLAAKKLQHLQTCNTCRPFKSRTCDTCRRRLRVLLASLAPSLQVLREYQTCGVASIGKFAMEGPLGRASAAKDGRSNIPDRHVRLRRVSCGRPDAYSL